MEMKIRRTENHTKRGASIAGHSLEIGTAWVDNASPSLVGAPERDGGSQCMPICVRTCMPSLLYCKYTGTAKTDANNASYKAFAAGQNPTLVGCTNYSIVLQLKRDAGIQAPLLKALLHEKVNFQ